MVKPLSQYLKFGNVLMKKYVVFRLDANPSMGIGHLMRCLTLANQFHTCGFNVAFICRYSSLLSLTALQQTCYELFLLGDTLNFYDEKSLVQDAQETLDILRSINAFLVVVDHYQLDAFWERRISKLNYQIMVIDDLANRPHECQYLLDSSLRRMESDYISYVRPETKLMLGQDYSLLRKGFIHNREIAKKKRLRTKVIESILINFGGTDPNRFTFKALEALEALSEKRRFKINIVVSNACPWIEELTILSNEDDRLTLIVDAESMENIILESDLAIGSLGTTSWERCCLGLPSIAMVTADNQLHNAQTLSEFGVILLSSEDTLDSDFLNFVDNLVPSNKWKEMSNKGFNLIDGLGIYRVCKIMLSSEFSMQEMNATHLNSLYQWQLEPNARTFSRNKTVPSYADHSKWFRQSLLSQNRRMWMILVSNIPAGYVRLDSDDDNNIEEVSILISEKFRGIGLARFAIESAKNERRYSNLLAYVEADNVDSLNLFKACGFTKIKHNYYLWGEHQGGLK